MQSPVFFQLDHAQPLIDFLQERGWLAQDERVEKVEKAGEGNMNFVARLYTNRRSLIFKQSRPWVEKYPQIPAPVERNEIEIAFYRAVEHISPVREGMPALLSAHQPAHCALFEDLGNVTDYTSMYNNEPATRQELTRLIQWLSHLHQGSFPATVRERLENREMRILNHAHLFDIPLQPSNGLDLDSITPGLQAAAALLQTHTLYVESITRLGERYLGSGNTLLHGDFYPGSWVKSPQGPRVIDPEFGFFGPAEFDIGVCMAHLYLAGYSAQDAKAVFAAYEAGSIDNDLANQFAGMEIMRRLIGVAQLPLECNLKEKKALLALSEKLVLGQSTHVF